MTKITAYKCNYCGQIFDNKKECMHHELQHKYEELKKSENCEFLKFFDKDGEEINIFNYPSCDDIEAVEIHSFAQGQFVNDYFNAQGYNSPIKIKDGQIKHFGLWYFDPDYYYNPWLSYEEALEDIQKIGKKFNQRA